MIPAALAILETIWLRKYMKAGNVLCLKLPLAAILWNAWRKQPGVAKKKIENQRINEILIMKAENIGGYGWLCS